jgi:predicted permease
MRNQAASSRKWIVGVLVAACLVMQCNSYLMPHRIQASPLLSINVAKRWNADPRCFQPVKPIAAPGFPTMEASSFGVRPSSLTLKASPSLNAVGKLLSTCGIGMACTKAGVIDKGVLSVLSKLIFNLLQPCLLFSNIAATTAKLGSQGSAVWFLPLAALGQILLGMLVGNIVALFLYGTKPSDDKNHFLMCTTFGNSGPLPLVFVDALLRTHKNTQLLPQAIGFVSLYLLGWSPLFWIIGPGILKPVAGTDANAGDGASGGSSAIMETLKRVMSPPVIASILGVIVGATGPLRDLFVKDGGLLNPLFDATRTLGSGYLPCVLLVLAGSLLPSPSDSSPPAPNAVPNATPDTFDRANFTKQVAAIYLSRFLLMPMVTMSLIPIIKSRFPGTLSALLSDPVLLLVLFLEACMPSAQNSTVILTLFGDRAGSAKIARVLMAVYVLGVPALSYWLSKILHITGVNA